MRFRLLIPFTAAIVLVLLAATVPGRVSAQVAGAPRATPPPESQSVPEFMAWYAKQPRVTMPVPAEGATVLVVKFTDLQCPACALTHEAYKPVLAKYEAQFPGAVKLAKRDFPFNRECNDAINNSMHPAACDAAIAVRLARRNGLDAVLEDWLYANQQVLTPQTVRRAALMLAEVSNTDFDAGRARAIQNIKAEAAIGAALGVDATPTFFINGVKVPKVMEPALLQAAVDYELRKAGKIK